MILIWRILAESNLKPIMLLLLLLQKRVKACFKNFVYEKVITIINRAWCLLFGG